MKPKILVLGANSFAGATFTNYMSDLGYEIIGVSRSELSVLSKLLIAKNENIQYFSIDINLDGEKLKRLLSEARPQIIVDFAGQGMVAESWNNPNQWYTTNLISKISLFEFLRNQNWLEKYIRISTPEVYGSNLQPVDESFKYNPSTPYAVSHAAIDMNVKIYFERYGFPGVIGRFANFYGPGQQLYRIVPKTIMSILKNIQLPLHGGGYSERAFIHSEDFASGIERLVGFGEAGQFYNFSPSELVSIRHLVEQICVKMGVAFDEFIVDSSDRPSKDQKYLMDSTKSKLELSWQARKNLDKGVSETIDWYLEHKDALIDLGLEYTHRP